MNKVVNFIFKELTVLSCTFVLAYFGLKIGCFEAAQTMILYVLVRIWIELAWRKIDDN